MCVEMGKMFLENVFIEQLLRTGIPFNSGASHKNTKSTKMGKMFLKSVFTECCSGVRMVLDAHSGIIDYLCKRNMTKEEIIERTLEYLNRMVVMQTIIKPKNDNHSIKFYTYPYQALEESITNSLYHRDYREWEPVVITVEPIRKSHTIILPISFMCHERLFNVTSTFYVHRTS